MPMQGRSGGFANQAAGCQKPLFEADFVEFAPLADIWYIQKVGPKHSKIYTATKTCHAQTMAGSCTSLITALCL